MGLFHFLNFEIVATWLSIENAGAVLKRMVPAF